MMHDFFQNFLAGLRTTSIPEYVAVVAGIISVWFSRKENVLVYPVGLVNTTFYVYLSIDGELYGEASVNFYYTVMSIYGWILWAKKDKLHHHILHVTRSSRREWLQQLAFFAAVYLVLYFALLYLKTAFYSNTIPAADAFASATAYTGMWLMAKKKVESWYWWILTDAAAVPLYYVKGFNFTSIYYLILFFMAIAGLIKWSQKANSPNPQLA